MVFLLAATRVLAGGAAAAAAAGLPPPPSAYWGSQRHIIRAQPAAAPPRFSGATENSGARRVDYFAVLGGAVGGGESDIREGGGGGGESGIREGGGGGGGAAGGSVTYGGILCGISSPPVESAECVAAAEAAVRLLKAMAASAVKNRGIFGRFQYPQSGGDAAAAAASAPAHVSVFGARDIEDILFCRRHALRVTNDHGKSRLTLPMELQTATGSKHRVLASAEEGVNYYLKVKVRRRQQGSRRTATFMLHTLTLNYDREGHYNLYHHSWRAMAVGEEKVPVPVELAEVAVGADGTIAMSESEPPHNALRILTLNVWNTNPPAWVFVGSPGSRQKRYDARIDHLARVIMDSGADLVGLQEVRYDASIGTPGDRFQMHHLLRRLGPGWHFTYNPSMNYFDAQRFARNGREEEGAAMLSRYPITETDFLLLPRFWDDSEDNQHQRQCLRARVQVPGLWGAVELFTTHLSLSERARNASVAAMWDFVLATSGEGAARTEELGETDQRPTLQVMLGDFNAEPDSAAIQYLQGLRTLGGSRTDLKDAWLEAGHAEPEPRSQDPEVRRNALTFPSDDPKKRIDLILYRRGGGGGGGSVAVESVVVVGQDAEASTKDDPGHGMLDGDSPMWASDHRGVFAEFRRLDA